MRRAVRSPQRGCARLAKMVCKCAAAPPSKHHLQWVYAGLKPLLSNTCMMHYHHTRTGNTTARSPLPPPTTTRHPRTVPPPHTAKVQCCTALLKRSVGILPIQDPPAPHPTPPACPRPVQRRTHACTCTRHAHEPHLALRCLAPHPAPSPPCRCQARFNTCKNKPSTACCQDSCEKFVKFVKDDGAAGWCGNVIDDNGVCVLAGVQ